LLKRGSPLIAASVLIGGLLLSTVGAAVAAPVTPQFTISADRAAAVPAGHRWEFNDFFPRTATIASGGTFQFANGGGFHTATLLPANWSVAADNDVNGAAAADIDDTALNPNGTIKLVESIPAILPVPAQGCGTPDAPCVFDGTGVVSMGLPIAGPPPTGPPAPFVVTVTAPPGTYSFHCRVHPWMAGTLNVVAAGSPGVTTAALADAAAATQAADDVVAGMAAEAAASKAGQVKHPNGTTTWTVTLGTSDPAGHVGVLDMLPRKITIKKGDTVLWRPLDRNEVHTVTFPKALAPGSPLCEGPGGRDTPAVPTVNPPMSPLDFACNGGPAEFEVTGGNAVTAITSPKTVSDSGIVAYRTVAAGFDLPAQAVRSSWWVKFAGASAGTYHYVCQIHDGMDGTIVVR
jgi:plastocyanin